MRLTINPKDDEAFKRIVNYPKRGIGDKVIETLANHAESRNISLYEACFEAELTPRARTLINDFIRLIESIKEKNIETNAYETARYIIKSTHITEIIELEKTIEAQSRIENINALMNGIQEFVENDEFSLDEIAEKET